MTKHNESYDEQLKKQLNRLNETYAKKHAEAKQLEAKLDLMTREFNRAERLKHLLNIIHPRTIKRTLRTIGSYVLGRRNRRRLYSRTYKQKQASNDLKPYIDALYTKGFTKKALADLHDIYERTRNNYLRRAIAWELALWYTKYPTIENIERALNFLTEVKKQKTKENFTRKIAIIEAECYVYLNEQVRAKQILNETMNKQTHPDLYLAYANTENDLTKKLSWVNKALAEQNLLPITCKNNEKHYDALQTNTNKTVKDGPKISVILPAYNAEKGISVAIESILNQTWQNLELLIIDDCSTDNTLQVIEQYKAKDDRIQVFQTKTNSGPYVARNIGLKQATGQFVTINDADDWSHAEKLAIQANHLLKNKTIIANTSEQARLQEDLTFDRRGTPGTYIFSNMSSLMFRRDEVLETIGYWDEVRFAADGEFKRRLTKGFGQDKVIDLNTGPLSFPRQSKTSLTASSAFGYDGFFMGARKEYVESFTHYHTTAKNLYYPKQPQKRPFPVPEPMLPARKQGKRTFDIVLATDFHHLTDAQAHLIAREINQNKQLNLKTALMQLNRYKLTRKQRPFHPTIRKLIDGDQVQRIVYGETIDSKLLIIHSPTVLNEEQTYLPKIYPFAVLIVIDEMPILEYNRKRNKHYNVRQCLQHLMIYTNRRGRWYPLNEKVRQTIEKEYTHEFRSVTITQENWMNENERIDEQYAKRLEPWLIDRSK